jgi:hypothetical protein
MTTPARAGCAIVDGYPNSTTHTIIETDNLPPISTFQKAELYALP